MCSTVAVNLGYDTIKGMQLALEYTNKYDKGQDCINALIEIIKQTTN